MALSNQPLKGERPYPNTIIFFSDVDYSSDMVEPHEGALVITTQVRPVDMRRIMIDNGSSVDIIYSHTYQMIDLEGMKMEVEHESTLYEV